MHRQPLYREPLRYLKRHIRLLHSRRNSALWELYLLLYRTGFRQADPDAYTYYLAAILAARTNQAADVAANLAKAIKLDRTMLEKAKNDVEFVKYAASLAGL